MLTIEKFSITYIHVRFKGEKKSTYTYIQKKKEEWERRGNDQAVVEIRERERVKYSDKRTWHAIAF